MGTVYEDAVRRKLSEIFSPTAVDHIMQPRNWGEMTEADGHARITGPCGDTMAIWLRGAGQDDYRRILRDLWLRGDRCLR